jgi:hypothetical protein
MSIQQCTRKECVSGHLQNLTTRCRIVHSRITHSYLLNNEEGPECIPCNFISILKHILTDCVDVTDARQTFYNVNTSRECK